MDKDFENIMKEHYEAMADAEQEQTKKDNEVLELVKSRVRPQQFEEIECVLEDSENTYNYLITDKPKGELQEIDEYPHIGGIYVNQTTNGGYVGDDFAGTVSIKISENQYFEFNYWM